MAKVNTYVPDDLWEAMCAFEKQQGDEAVNWSAVFQRAVRKEIGADAPLGSLSSRVAGLEGRRG